MEARAGCSLTGAPEEPAWGRMRCQAWVSWNLTVAPAPTPSTRSGSRARQPRSTGSAGAESRVFRSARGRRGVRTRSAGAGVRDRLCPAQGGHRAGVRQMRTSARADTARIARSGTVTAKAMPARTTGMPTPSRPNAVAPKKDAVSAAAPSSVPVRWRSSLTCRSCCSSAFCACS